jgi:hypothetical protein
MKDNYPRSREGRMSSTEGVPYRGLQVSGKEPLLMSGDPAVGLCGHVHPLFLRR